MPQLNPQKSTLTHRFPFEGAWPTSIAFIGSSNRLAVGNRNGQVFLWDLPQGGGEVKEDSEQAVLPPTRQLDGHANGVTHLLAMADGKTLISSSLDHAVRVWDTSAAASGSVEAVLDIETRQRQAKRTREDDALKQPGVKVEVQSDSRILAGHSDWVGGLGLSGDGRRMISGDDRCRVQVWDTATWKVVANWQGQSFNWVTSASLSPDGQSAFVGEYCSRRGDFDRPPAQAKVWNVAEGKEKLDLLAIQFPDVKVRDNSYGYATKWGKFVARGFVTSAFSPDGKILALGQGGETSTGKVHLIDTATGKLLRTVSGHQYGVTDVAFSSDGKYVLSCGRDTTVRICQTADGKEVAALGKPRGGQFKDWFYALALSPDQTTIAAADIAGKIHVWRFDA